HLAAEVGDAGRHRRVDVAGADRVDADPARRHLARDGAREGEDAALGRAVVRHGLETHQRGDAGEVHDGPGVPAAHDLQRLTRAVERAVQVHADHVVPGLVAHRLRDVPVRLHSLAGHHLHDARLALAHRGLAVVAGPHGHARVVDEDVQAAVLAVDDGEHRADGLAVGDVGRDRARAGAERLGRGLGGFLADVVDDHARALVGEALADGAADARAAARDERHTILELHRWVLPGAGHCRRNSPRATVTAQPPTSTLSMRSRVPPARAKSVLGRPISTPCVIWISWPGWSRP